MRLLLKGFSKLIGKILFTRYALVFINGFLVACLLYFYIEDNYEQQLFKAMADYVNDKTPQVKKNEEALLLQSLHLAWYLGETRSSIFQNKKINSLESSLIHPVTVDLMTTDRACGSYAFILSAILTELKVPNRIAQMTVGGTNGGHILVEAKTAKGWAVLDGTYNLYFRRPDGELAGFSDVMADWNYYKQQVPGDYNSTYRYEGVRYTNWNKIPVVMPLMKNVLSLCIGKKRTEQLSLRTFCLRKFNMLFWITGALYLALMLMVIRRYFKRNRNLFVLYFPVLFPAERSPLIGTVKSMFTRT